MLRFIALAAVGASIAIAGCSDVDSETNTSKGTDATATAPPINLLFVVLDALAAGHASTNGYPPPTTPQIAAYAEGGVVFTQARSQATSTRPSTWSFLTGRYPYIPRLNTDVSVVRGADSVLPEWLRELGVATGGFSENPFIQPKLAMNKGFDTFEYFEPEKATGGDSDFPFLDQYRRGTATSNGVVDRALDWIRSQGDTPWFCYVHLLRPHNPYFSTPELVERFAGAIDSDAGASLEQEVLRMEVGAVLNARKSGAVPDEDSLEVLSDVYDSNVAYSDQLTGRLLDAVRDAGVLDDTLVIVTSDHGEAFGEHGFILHAREPFEELIHVPLVILPPAAAGIEPRRVNDRVQLVDLAPTVAEIFGYEPPAGTDGRSLVSLMTTGEPLAPRAEFAMNRKTSTLSVVENELKVMIHFDAQFREPVQMLAFDLSVDPGEVEDVFDARKHDRYVRMLRRYAAEHRERGRAEPPNLSDDDLEAIRALGYAE